MYSGVAFSGFMQGAEHVFMIEYAEGLGEDLVQGRLIPGRIQLCRSSGIIKSELGQALPHTYVQQLYQLGMLLEKRETRIVDFEWAIDHQGKLFLLQVRPVTQDGRFEKYLSNANMNENYPKPVTPFLYSFAARGYQHYFLQLGIWTGIPKRILKAAEPDLKRILGIHEGRLYYDLSAVRACFSHLPFSAALIRYWDDFLGIGTLPLESPKSSLRSFLFPLRFILRLSLWMCVFPWLARRFQRRVEAALSRRYQGDPLQVCQDRLHSISAIRFHGWGEAALCDAAVMIHSGIMKTFLKRALPGDMIPEWNAQMLAGSASSSLNQWNDLIALHKICAEFPQISRLLQEEKWTTAWEHIHQSARYERLRKALQNWLDSWGSRVSGELMLTETNYFDDPTLLLRFLTQPIRDRERKVLTPSLSSLWRIAFQHRGLASGIAATLAFLASKPAHAAIAARESCRLAQSKLYGALRANLLSIGRLLQARGLLNEIDDPFFLSYDELQDLLHECSYSHELTKQSIAQRRLQFARYQNARVPERIGRRKGRPWFSRESMSRRNQTPANAADNCRFGFPASSGTVKGRVRILHSTDESGRLRAGEILVTRETDPGWIVAMGRAAALVVERGGILSHGAIVARELGIPAVIGLVGITDDLQDGMEIEVDGQRGMIAWNNSASYGDGETSAFASDATGLLH
jgi:pyruvate,water dikinase